ncbi:MAG: hypothetical protein V3W19_05110 [Desulfatiglandales bacterium]
MQRIIIAFIWFLIFSALQFSAVTAVTVEGIEQISEFGNYPSWSPDGTKIVFASSNGIWVMELDGSAKKKILEESLSVSFPIWSPDDRGILYSKKGKSYYVDISGENKRDFYFLRSDNYHIHSSWSPDGNEIVYDSSGTIKLYDLRGLSGAGSIITGKSYSPSWSPDGAEFVYRKLMESDNSDVWISNRDGLEDKDVTNTPDLDEINPSWSPDGKRIAFGCECLIGPSREKGIFVMDTDGNNRKLLTYYPGSEILGGLSWSPDGTKIAFGYEEFSTLNDGGIYVIKLGGITPVAPRILDYTPLSARGDIEITTPENITDISAYELPPPEVLVESGKRLYIFRYVRVGEYDFLIRKEGYENYAFTVEVKPGEITKISAELTPILPETTAPPTTAPPTTTLPPTTQPPIATKAPATTQPLTTSTPTTTESEIRESTVEAESKPTSIPKSYVYGGIGVFLLLFLLSILIPISRKKEKPSVDVTKPKPEPGPISEPPVEKTPEVDVEINFPTEFTYVGEKARIYAKVDNKGDSKIKDVKLSAQFPKLLNVSNAIIEFYDIFPKDSMTKFWEINPDNPGRMSIYKPTLLYTDMKGKKNSRELDTLQVQVKETSEKKGKRGRITKRSRKALLSPWCPECNKYKGREPECPHCGYTEGDT